jgi:uncharacterized protein (DUF342 family)
LAVEKSVIVQGKSIEEALERAALLLHATTSDLAHEILQQGLVDPNGAVRIPYKLRVLPIVSPPQPREDFEWPEEDFVPPVSQAMIAAWTHDEFIHALQAAIASQPTSNRAPVHKQKRVTSPPMEILGGLGAMYGSLLHDGDIIIRGNVARGVNINAAGSIMVYGDVEVSQLDAGVDINITGGMLGIARTLTGSVTCLFAQGAYIESGKHITITESSLHSNLLGGSSIDVGQTIIGGTCTAPHAIIAKVVGSETGVVTKLCAGCNSNIREEAEAIRREAARLIARLGEVSILIKEVESALPGSPPANITDRLKLWTSLSEKAKLNDRLVTLARRKNTLISSLDQDRSARIKVSDKVHPQTHIEIDDVGMTVKKITQYVTFSKDYEAGALRITSYS